MTLNQLIDERIVDSIIKDYKLDISDETFADYIQGIKAFQNEEGIFDKSLFDRVLASSNLSSEEFINSYKRMLLENLIFGIYQSSAYVPNLLKENILNYILDKRTFDLVSIDLSSKSHVKIPNYTEQELEDFYHQNQKLFEVPESRKLNYIIIKYKDLLQKSKVNDLNILDYYEKNKENFENKTFDESKAEIESILKSNMESSQISDFLKALEDEIALGLSLNQISKKQDLKIYSIEDFTKDYQSKEPDLKDFKDRIMNMQEQEVSYPMEVKEGLIIFEIEKIKNTETPTLKEIYNKVVVAWENHQYEQNNLGIIQNFAQIANSQNFIDQASKLGLDINHDISVSRNKQDNDKNIEDSLLNEVFISNINQITKLVIYNGKAYIAKINNISKNSISNEEEDNIKQNINNNIKRSMIDDIITHLKYINKVQINTKLLEREE
jgi:peptidyl-prolyl cis-trans isomerase D